MTSLVELPLTPFRGIEEFRFIDQKIFPSRVAEVQRLLRLVTIYRGVLLYGDSGVGKSSLINAGLIPEAIKEGYAPERIRVDPRPGAEIIVERISYSADDEPPYLPSRFAKNAKARRVTLSVEEFEENVTEGSKQTDQYPLLIFDQFEELLTLAEQPRMRARTPAVESVQEPIVASLLRILADGTIRVKILFAFREDFLAKLSKIFGRHPNLNDQFLRLDPLTINELPTIIRTPFDRADFPRQLPQDVTADLEDQFCKRGETNLLNLSEVQIAALRLWQADDPKKLLAERGVGGLIEDYFSEAVEGLGNLQQAAMLLLIRMVTYSDTRNVVSRDDLLHDVAKDVKISQGKLDKALKALEKGRVVRGERRSNVVVYEIVSEYLVPWIARKRSELAAEKRQREYIEQINRDYVEQIENREKLRWRRIVKAYQLAIGGAIAVVISISIYNFATSNRALNDKNNKLERLNAQQEQRIDELTKQLNTLRSQYDQQKKTSTGLIDFLRSRQVLAAQAGTARAVSSPQAEPATATTAAKKH
jgi:DNA-binding transcriptional ArsR family regulator